MVTMNIPINFYDAPYWLEYQELEFKKNVYHRNVIELIFVIKGELTVDIEGSETILEEGEFICINAGILHMLKGKKNTYIASVYIDLNYFEKRYSFIRGFSFYCLYKKDNPDETEIYHVIRNYFIRLLIIEHNKIPKLNEVATDIIESIVDILINHIVDGQYTKNKVSEMKEADRERLYSMTTFMANNFHRQGLSLSDLAAHENLSATRLSHFWKSITNISFMDTIVLYRFNEARRLLMESDMSVFEITQLCGISDEKYLYRSIKEKYNMTPKEFRENHKKEMEVDDIYEPKSIQEIYDVIKDYSGKYYYKVSDFSFMNENEDRVEEEKNLNDLYGIITLVDKYKETSQEISKDSLLIKLGINHGLRKDGDEISISWEYIYAMFQISLTMYARASLAIEVELLSADEWVATIARIRKEIVKKYSSDYQTVSNLYITFVGYDNYKKALALQEKLKSESFYESIRPVLFV